jgi:hypothetical protein
MSLLEIQTAYAYARACAINFSGIVKEYSFVTLKFEAMVKNFDPKNPDLQAIVAEYVTLYDWTSFDEKAAEKWKPTDPFDNKKVSQSNSVRNVFVWLRDLDLMSDSTPKLVARLTEAADVIVSYTSIISHEIPKIKELIKRVKSAKVDPADETCAIP